MNAYEKLEEGLSEIEKSLQKTLSPITPDPRFVNRLKTRLITEPAVILDENPLAWIYLIISFGMFIGVFIFWMIRKMVRLGKLRGITQAYPGG